MLLIQLHPHRVHTQQERALLLRRGADFTARDQLLLALPSEETPPPQPACWAIAFSPGPAASPWLAVAGWSGAVHIYATAAAPSGSQQQQQQQPPRTPVLSIPPPAAPAAASPPQEGNLVAGLAWRGGGGNAVQLELLVLRYSGHFARHVVRPPPRWVGGRERGTEGGGAGRYCRFIQRACHAPTFTSSCLSTTHQRNHDPPPPPKPKNSAPETLVVVGSWKTMNLRAWHRPACTAMAYERASDRLVVAGGSLRDGQCASQSVVVVAGWVGAVF